MDRDDDTQSRLIDEAEFRRVLHRAAELDQIRERNVSESVLLDIAADVGITAESVRQALLEEKPKSSQHWKLTTRSWTLLRASLLAAILGGAAREMRPSADLGGVNWETLGALVVISGGVLIASWRPNRSHHQLRFQLLNVASWAGFALGWFVMDGRLWGDLADVIAMWAIAVGMAGGVIAALRGKRGPANHGGPQNGGVSAAASMTTRVRTWWRNKFGPTSAEGPSVLCVPAH